MTLSWAKKLTSLVTVLSVTAALVVGVYSQSHAAFSAKPQTEATDPCAEHLETPAGSLASDNCEALCYLADLNHLLGAPVDRINEPELVFAPVSYETVSDSLFQYGDVWPFHYGRGPPGSDLYLITQRLRL